MNIAVGKLKIHSNILGLWIKYGKRLLFITSGCNGRDENDEMWFMFRLNISISTYKTEPRFTWEKEAG